ncbi:MAG: N-formylglutamate amidohydrolase [Nitratireductor sp.]|nr:N-formylglutamate amidohydrolase [Nitratireductor sp.]
MNSADFFTIARPQRLAVPVVFNSPHSGRHYPADFLKASGLDGHALRRSEDFVVDQLFSGAMRHGAPLLSARFPRAWLDVNREPFELDPQMFSGALPAHANTQSARVQSGLGTIARIVAENEEIYRARLPVEEALARIEQVYKPYHAALRGLLAEAMAGFGHAILIDCHSMPSTQTVQRSSPFGSRRQELLRSDFVLGDRYGTACAPFLVHGAAAILREQGYRVAINKPYAGGFITEHYGRPEKGLHALQIEVNRALYMNEPRIEKTAGFDVLAGDLDRFIERLMALVLHEADDAFAATIPLAAE